MLIGTDIDPASPLITGAGISMPPSPSPLGTSAVSLRRARKHAERAAPRNSTATDDSGHYQRQRLQRATCACERCRVKKLRCTGGYPCSACRRARTDCDFGDPGLQSPHISLSGTNERLAQLERTVAELVSSLRTLAQSRHLSAPAELAGRPASPVLYTQRSLSPRPLELADPRHHAPVSDRTTETHAMATSSLFVQQATLSAAPAAQDPPGMATSERMSSGVTNNAEPGELGSRWTALQHHSAPFPPLMSYPAVWSGEPAKTSPEGDQTAQPALGITNFNARVDLHSEPISNGILSESLARSMFTLFFQKCHPSFPLLEPYKDLQQYFDHLRSTSPFLITAILAIAARYYTRYRGTQPAPSSLPPITSQAREALAELACAHLGFVLLRKQHLLSDVQAALLLCLWIPRGKGQSADQWMITGLCTRLAYRIGVPEACGHPSVARLLNSTQPETSDIREVNNILSQWHTWLSINLYDTLLSLGFGRPYTMPFCPTNPRQYLTIVRKLGPLVQVDLVAATYVTSLAELSAIVTDLITGLRLARFQPTPRPNTPQPNETAWSKIFSLLIDLNPRLDDWQRQWTWSGSYDAITLGRYTTLAKIYGEHLRLCLNSLSLNLIAASANDASPQDDVVISCLGRACEAAVAIVQYSDESYGAESVIRYGEDYLVLLLAQAAMFFVRVLVARLQVPLPIEQPVLMHYLKTAIKILESNDFSTTHVSGWLAQLSRDLVRYAGLALDGDVDGDVDGDDDGVQAQTGLPTLEPTSAEVEWDFDVRALLGQTNAIGETSLDFGSYFDFAQPFFPTSFHPGMM